MAAQNLYDICKIHENIQHVKRTSPKETSFLQWQALALLFFQTEGRFNKAVEQGMRLGRAGFKFRMELAADEPGMILDFDDFDQTVVRGRTGQDQAGIDHFRTVLIVEFPAVTMAFINEVGIVYFLCLRTITSLQG